MVRYSYPKGKCRVNMSYAANNGPEHPVALQSNECIYDMVSMMLRARSFDPAGWNEGERRNFVMADGRDCGRQSILFRGRQTFKVEHTDITYRCLVFSFIERKNNKEKEIVRFYITDDANHLPVRLDMNLNFGTAKAFLRNASGVRHPQTSIVH